MHENAISKEQVMYDLKEIEKEFPGAIELLTLFSEEESKRGIKNIRSWNFQDRIAKNYPEYDDTEKYIELMLVLQDADYITMTSQSSNAPLFMITLSGSVRMSLKQIKSKSTPSVVKQTTKIKNLTGSANQTGSGDIHNTTTQGVTFKDVNKILLDIVDKHSNELSAENKEKLKTIILEVEPEEQRKKKLRDVLPSIENMAALGTSGLNIINTLLS